MARIVRSLHPIFAAEILGADLSVSPDEDLVAEVEAAMARFAVTVIRDARAARGR